MEAGRDAAVPVKRHQGVHMLLGSGGWWRTVASCAAVMLICCCCGGRLRLSIGHGVETIWMGCRCWWCGRGLGRGERRQRARGRGGDIKRTTVWKTCSHNQVAIPCKVECCAASVVADEKQKGNEKRVRPKRWEADEGCSASRADETSSPVRGRAPGASTRRQAQQTECIDQRR